MIVMNAKQITATVSLGTTKPNDRLFIRIIEQQKNNSNKNPLDDDQLLYKRSTT